MRKVTLVVVGVVAMLGTLAAQQAPRQNACAPEGTPIALSLAGYAKVLCSVPAR